MKEEGFKGTWPEFLKRQEEAMKGIDRNRVVEDGIGAKRIALNLEGGSVTPREEITVTDSDWDLGPYLPVDFEVTSWDGHLSLSEVNPFLPGNHRHKLRTDSDVLLHPLAVWAVYEFPA